MLRVELWAAALSAFAQPVPSYEPGDRHLLQSKNWTRHLRAREESPGPNDSRRVSREAATQPHPMRRSASADRH
jgi:hypothetical protein